MRVLNESLIKILEMKNILPPNWGVLRVVNTLLGFFFLSQFVLYLDWFALVFASILLIQSYLNVGCLMGACMTPGAFSPKENTAANDEIIYDEIEPK